MGINFSNDLIITWISGVCTGTVTYPITFNTVYCFITQHVGNYGGYGAYETDVSSISGTSADVAYYGGAVTYPCHFLVLGF